MKKTLTLLLRKYNFRGKWRLINLLRDKNIPSELVIPYKNQTLISIDTTELIGHDIYWNGGYENSVMWILDLYLEKDDIAIDFGANRGVEYRISKKM